MNSKTVTVIGDSSSKACDRLVKYNGSISPRRKKPDARPGRIECERKKGRLNQGASENSYRFWVLAR